MADTKLTTKDVADVVEGEVWKWLNRHDASWSPSDGLVNDLAYAVAEQLSQPPGQLALTPVEVVAQLDAIEVEHGDSEGAHGLADKILLLAAPPEVAAAYDRVVKRSHWWGTA